MVGGESDIGESSSWLERLIGSPKGDVSMLNVISVAV